MAKVTIILEDHIDENGVEGMIIDYDPENDYDGKSLAHQYAASFVQHIMAQAKSATIEDKGEATPPMPNKEESELN